MFWGPIPKPHIFPLLALLSCLLRAGGPVYRMGASLLDQFKEALVVLVGDFELASNAPSCDGREAITEAINQAEFILRSYNG
eukprot:2427204-Amphidinium_carterae.1